MKKILILANSSSGLYGFRNELVLRLLNEYEVYLSLPDEVNRKELEDEGCVFIQTPINRRGMNPAQDLKLLLTYLRLIREIRPTAVLTYTIKPNIYGGIACRLKRIPYLTTITGLGSTFQHDGLMKSLIVALYRTGVRGAKRVFFQNKENMGVFHNLKIIKESQCLLVQGSGVNTELHKYLEYPKTDATRFLFVGRVMKEKGIEEFLTAAEKLKNEKTFFDILGYCDEDYEERLLELQKKGIITWHGFRTDVDNFYQNASVLVLPTYHEGMSNVLMEASASGRPVLASDISGCREVFEDGRTGFGFLPQNSDALIAAMEKFLHLTIEERATMGYNARVKMQKEFSRQTVVDKYMEQLYCICKNENIV